MKRITIGDVAKKAGVSIKSVSRVINREPNVSEKLRARVQETVDALGFVPDFAARALAGARTFTIAVWFDNPSPHYIVKIQQGAMQACREAGYHLIIEDMSGDAGTLEARARSALVNARVDGIVLTPPLTDLGGVMNILEEKSIPYIRISPFSFAGRSLSVGMDDAGAAGEMLGHLLELGHRRIGIINGPPSHGASAARREGFLAAARRNNPDFPMIREVPGNFDFLSGIAASMDLLQAPERPTAIFATNDEMAAGAVVGANRLGLKVPDDVAIAGFDDSLIAQSVWPMLTTIYQPIAEMAAEAARLLIDRARAQGDATPRYFPHHLVKRESTERSR